MSTPDPNPSGLFRTPIQDKDVHPEGVTDNALVKFDGTTGLIQEEADVIIGDDGAITAGANDDVEFIFGRARFASPTSDNFFLAHYDNLTTTAYALRQNAGGSTLLNAKTGQDVSARVNNAEIIKFSAGADIRGGSDGGVALGTATVRFGSRFFVGGSVRGISAVQDVNGGNYTVLSTDDVLQVQDSGASGNSAVLPDTPTDGTEYIIHNEHASNNCTVSTAASDTIEGAATVDIGPDSTIHVIYDASETDWMVL
jgi:hypothetical protein